MSQTPEPTSPATSGAPSNVTSNVTAQRGRPVAELQTLALRVTELLRTPSAMMNLTPAEAACVTAHMQIMNFAQGVTLFREGDAVRLDHMLLVLEGQVRIDSLGSGQISPVAISVVGPGSVIGEMALLDGSPRSASCVTVTPVQAAGLSRKALEMLFEEYPQVAAKLLIGLSTRTSERLRALGEQLQIYASLVDNLQAEVNRLRSSAPSIR